MLYDLKQVTHWNCFSILLIVSKEAVSFFWLTLRGTVWGLCRLKLTQNQLQLPSKGFHNKCHVCISLVLLNLLSMQWWHHSPERIKEICFLWLDSVNLIKISLYGLFWLFLTYPLKLQIMQHFIIKKRSLDWIKSKTIKD